MANGVVKALQPVSVQAGKIPLPLNPATRIAGRKAQDAKNSILREQNRIHREKTRKQRAQARQAQKGLIDMGEEVIKKMQAEGMYSHAMQVAVRTLTLPLQADFN